MTYGRACSTLDPTAPVRFSFYRKSKYLIPSESQGHSLNFRPEIFPADPRTLLPRTSRSLLASHARYPTDQAHPPPIPNLRFLISNFQSSPPNPQSQISDPESRISDLKSAVSLAAHSHPCPPHIPRPMSTPAFRPVPSSFIRRVHPSPSASLPPPQHHQTAPAAARSPGTSRVPCPPARRHHPPQPSR